MNFILIHYMRLREKITDKLTRFYLNKLCSVEFKKKINYSYGKYSREVFIFLDEKKPPQTTPWNTIVMPEILFKNYSKRVRDLFFLHEYGHTKLNIIFRTILYFSLIPLLLLHLFSLFFSKLVIFINF